MHQVIMTMLHTSELNMANIVEPSDISDFFMDAEWTICSTYHTVLKASSCTAIFGRDMLFDIPFLVNRDKIGQRQCQTNLHTQHENRSHVGIIKWVTKYLFAKKVSSANQKVSFIVIFGLHLQSIVMVE